MPASSPANSLRFVFFVFDFACFAGFSFGLANFFSDVCFFDFVFVYDNFFIDI
jgi:hypothetical protein